MTEEFALQYFRLQQATIIAVFESSGIGVAHALSREFLQQWGPYMPSWLQKPLFAIVRSIIGVCVSVDRRHLPLLDVFGTWVRGEAGRQELIAVLLQRCGEVGLGDGRGDAHVAAFRRRILCPREPARRAVRSSLLCCSSVAGRLALAMA